ncbi:MAG: WG repeat-containing protein [Bacteroidota bacterium]
MQKNLYLLFLFLIFSFSSYAKSIEDGYEALKIYNYFEAKRIFEKKISKQESPCAFGLAIIYFRNDNPFHNLDSSFKYVLKAEKSFALVTIKTQEALAKYNFNELEIIELKRKISSEYFQFTKKINTEQAYINFLENHPWANERFIALSRRDSLAFYQAIQLNTSQSFAFFISKYPESEFTKIAQKEIHLKEFEELTQNKTLAEYMLFIEEKPSNPFVTEAENQIFKLQTKINTLDSYEQFIQNFPKNRNVDLAWRKLFQIYMYNYSDERIKSFRLEYPDYPFQNEINEELNMSKQTLLPYKRENYYGWMNDQGEVLSDASYESLSLYKEGLAQASSSGKIGFLDKNNKVVIPFEYEQATDFEDGRSIVEKNGKMGIIDRTGKIIFDIVFEDIGNYSEGLVYAKKDSLYAYYDRFGTQIIKERFEEAFSFNGKYALVVLKNDLGNVFQNYIDKIGNLLFPLKYESINILNDRLFSFQNGDYYGIMDIHSKIIQEAKYDEISSLSENRIAFVLNGKIGYFNEIGGQIIPPTYDYMTNFSKHALFTAGYAKVCIKGKYGLIDVNGKMIIPAIYQNIGEISDLVSFQKDGLWGYINLLNKIIVAPTYDEARSFDNDAAIVSFNNRFGILNTKGEIIVPIIFDGIQKLTHKLYVTKVGEKQTLILADGTILTTDNYKQIRVLTQEYLILTNDNEVHYFYIPEMRIIKTKN